MLFRLEIIINKSPLLALQSRHFYAFYAINIYFAIVVRRIRPFVPLVLCTFVTIIRVIVPRCKMEPGRINISGGAHAKFTFVIAR